MKTGPRYKLAKRPGATVFEKAQTQKFAISADRSARNSRRRRGRQSEYGKQMLEKQKVRVTYGLPEKQFRNYVNKALAASGGGRKVRVPSYALSVGDVVGIREGSRGHGTLVGLADRALERALPPWLALDTRALEGKGTARPTAETADPAGDLSAVLSFYTR